METAVFKDKYTLSGVSNSSAEGLQNTKVIKIDPIACENFTTLSGLETAESA
jgi:hypothetical protein